MTGLCLRHGRVVSPVHKPLPNQAEAINVDPTDFYPKGNPVDSWPTVTPTMFGSHDPGAGCPPYLKPGVNQLLLSPFGGGFFMRIDDPSWRPSAGGAELSAIEFLAGTLAATERPINGCNPGVHFEFRRCAALRRWLLLLAGMEAPQIHQGSERIGAFFELLQRDPFIVRVRLANISGAKNRDIVEFRQARAVCSVGHRD